MIRNAVGRIVALVVSLIDWLLSFIPGTTANARRRVREAVAARMARLEAQSQKRYPGAKAVQLSAHGTVRSQKRSLRRMYTDLWSRAFPGWALSGRQFVRLRRSLANNGVVRGRAAHVQYFLHGGDVKPRKAVA